jgi:hypothetical protein
MQDRNSQADAATSVFCPRRFRASPSSPARQKNNKNQPVVPETFGGYATHHDLGGNVTIRPADTVLYFPAILDCRGTLASPQKFGVVAPLLSSFSVPLATTLCSAKLGPKRLAIFGSQFTSGVGQQKQDNLQINLRDFSITDLTGYFNKTDAELEFENAKPYHVKDCAVVKVFALSLIQNL